MIEGCFGKTEPSKGCFAIKNIAKRLKAKLRERPKLRLKGCSATKTVAERPNAKVCIKPNLSFLDESLILAQDERWRRA